MDARFFARRQVLGAAGLWLAVGAAAADGPDWSAVGPVFALRCTMCHAEAGAMRGLRLDSYAGALAGSENGAVLIPGDPEASELVRRVLGLSPPRMPFLGPALLEAEVTLIRQWISAGLPERSD